MIHFLYLLAFSAVAGTVFGAVAEGDSKKKILYGLRVFAQFIVISIVLGWIFYFIP